MTHPWEALYPPGLDWSAPLSTTTLPDLLARTVARHPTRIALTFGLHRISFADLAARIDHLARGLAGLGIGAGTTVGLLLPNIPWHPIALFALLRLGAIAVHLSPLDPPRATARKLADAGATTLIATDLPTILPNAATHPGIRLLIAEAAAFSLPGAPIPDAATPLSALPPAPLPTLRIDPSDTALLQFTGGTTGSPRAARLTHANLTAAVAIYDAWNHGIGRDFRPGDRVLCVLPLFHIYALTAVLLRCLASGTELVLHQRFDRDAVLDAIETGRCTHMNGVPTMWIALLDAPGIERRDLSSLRVASSGGAALPAEIAQRFHALTGIHLGGGWGMTETAPAGTNLLPGRPPVPGEIGVPLPGVELQVVALDDPSRPLPPGQPGELRIRGPNVTPGYWNAAAATDPAFVDGWFLTGDIARMEPDGRFVLVDRKKDMLVSGGFNVYPRAIEEAMHEHPDILEAAVIGVPDPYRGQAAKAFAVLRDGAPPLTLDTLRAFLSHRLGRHELPTQFEIRSALPHTQVGKLAKRELS